MSKRDYYEVLGVERSVDSGGLKTVFRKLALKYHPDRNPDDPSAEESFKEVAEAYEVLSDGDKRARYDRFGHAGLQGGGRAPPSEDIFSHFGDIFGDIFGGSRRRGNRPARGADLRYDLELTLEEAVLGAQHEIAIPRVQSCTTCAGKGLKDGADVTTCTQCKGSGQVARSQGPFMFSMTCPRCHGGGQSVRDEDNCSDCGGSGKQHIERKVSVRVPAGVDSGTRMRVSGEGEVGERGGPSGDLYVVLVVRPHEIFEREGDDLHTEVRIDVVTAVLGGKADVDLINGGAEVVRLPAGVQPDERVRIRGKGVPHLNGSGRGDLYAHVRVRIPKKLSREQKKLFEKLAATGLTTP